MRQPAVGPAENTDKAGDLAVSDEIDATPREREAEAELHSTHDSDGHGVIHHNNATREAEQQHERRRTAIPRG